MRIAMVFVLLPVLCSSAASLAGTAFPGQPTLLSAQGDGERSAWVAYQNGDVFRCRADTRHCEPMHGLPTFSTPVSLSADPGGTGAWIGWSDGALYRCENDGQCRAARAPSPVPRRLDP